MRVIFIIFIFSISGVSHSLEWVSSQSVDSVTDEQVSTAKVLSDSGYELAVYRVGDPGVPVLARFSVPSDSDDTIDPGRAPILRIDDNDPHDLSTSKRAAELTENLDVESGTLYEAKQKQVTFTIWHGEGAVTESEKLREIMAGEELLVRYYLVSGGHKDVTFSLENSSEAIRTAVGLTE